MLTYVNSPLIMSPRAKHPNKEIDAAVKYAESNGWQVKKSTGHAWGALFCPEKNQDGCIIRVWSTPQSPENHARQIVRFVNKCSHAKTSKTDGMERP